MADIVRFLDGTEAQILALTSDSPNWIDKAFYYPTDQDYFYRVVDGEMRIYGAGNASVVGVGITLNDKVIGGVKNNILINETLNIPENYEYNVYSLDVQGTINNSGVINIM